jgi:hypothetical protein
VLLLAAGCQLYYGGCTQVPQNRLYGKSALPPLSAIGAGAA